MKITEKEGKNGPRGEVGRAGKLLRLSAVSSREQCPEEGREKTHANAGKTYRPPISVLATVRADTRDFVLAAVALREVILTTLFHETQVMSLSECA